MRGGFNKSQKLAELRVTFYLVFFLLSFSLGVLTLLLSWPSCPTERESSAVSVGALDLGVGAGPRDGWACLEACH